MTPEAVWLGGFVVGLVTAIPVGLILAELLDIVTWPFDVRRRS